MPGWAQMITPVVTQMGNPVSIVIDKQVVALTQPGILYHGRVMVPLRGVFERLGVTVNYDPMTRAISAGRQGTDIDLALGSRLAMINGYPRELDVPPLNLNGTVLVPLRFVSEALGADVNWSADTHTVEILSRTGGVYVTSPVTPPIPQEAPRQVYPTTIGSSRLITGISISPHHVLPGQPVTVVMTGVPGGQAFITLENGEKIGLQETSSGRYEGSYTIPSDYEGKNLDVTGEIMLPNGQSDTLTNMNAISVSNEMSPLPGGVLPLELISPNPAAKVPQVFDVAGRTEPRALVRMRVLANQNDELVSTQTVADAHGNFHIHIDLGKRYGSGTHLIMQIHSEDNAGRSSNATQVELTRI